MNARMGAFLLAMALVGASSSDGAGWRALEAGLELGEFKSNVLTIVGDSTVVVLRVDPALWDLRLVCASAAGVTGNPTARGWAERDGLTAAINAGMFATDHSTHVGYLRAGEHVNSAATNQYKSVAALCPRREGIPRFRIFDLDGPGVSMAAINADYDCVVQNLRLIKRPRLNRWSQQEKMWSEAALGEDSRGRVLFIFSRSPYSVHDFNKVLMALPIDLQCAQHLEGGPEAQLYVRTPAFELELVGSYETGFHPTDGNHVAWPIPNVLGIVRR